MTEPVQEDSTRARTRTLLFTVAGAVLAAGLLFAVVARVAATRPTTKVEADGTPQARFDLGRAANFAPTIARSGPLLFPDPKARSRDIFVQHLGGDQWLAFEARATGAPRQCVLKWEQAARQFVDPCDGRIYPADGTGLVSFPTTVNAKGRVIVDLGNPTSPTTTPQAP